MFVLIKMAGIENSIFPKYEDTSMGPQLSTRVRGAEASPAAAGARFVLGGRMIPVQKAILPSIQFFPNDDFRSLGSLNCGCEG